jgi:predicted metal-dependent hydrolase
MNNSIIIEIIIGLIVIILAYYFLTSKSDTSYVESNFDHKKYLVQNLNNNQKASDILGIINYRIFLLRQYLIDHIDQYPEYSEYIKQFSERIRGLKLRENAPGGKYTSYTVNKGKEISLCLRSKKTGKLHDINLVMYVVLHELSHVACPEVDHTELFKKIFIFFLQIAIDIGIYTDTNYTVNPKEYCGLCLKENLLSH